MGIKTRQLGDEYLFGRENLKSMEETAEGIFVFQKYGNENSTTKRAFESPAELG